MSPILLDISYITASVLFIIGLKMMNKAASARKGNIVSSVGMAIAIGVTLFDAKVIGFEWIALGIAIGTLLGIWVSRSVKMTAMPELVAVLNGFGGLASMLVGWAEYHTSPSPDLFTAVSIYAAVFVGAVTFTGSMIAYGKLAEKISGKPFLFPGQNFVNAATFLAIVVLGILYCRDPAANQIAFFIAMGISAILGVLVVIPIGGADMPVVISLLNSYSGIAGCAAGFIILNNVLIVAGALVGASGIILTNIMCKAMNRPLTNVLFGGFGATASASGKSYVGEAKPISVKDTYLLLEAAGSVIFVPGYGMAVAQAQHVVRELAELLENNGTDVRFVIHPVAGRMPGHMNVLLAEANVDYDKLAIPEEVNPNMDTVDVAVVIGANDVVNPAAREDKTSPLWGMPIIDVDRAKTCIVLKRSLKAGFAGVDNPLFFKNNARMLFGDAKASVAGLVSEFKTT